MSRSILLFLSMSSLNQELPKIAFIIKSIHVWISILKNYETVFAKNRFQMFLSISGHSSSKRYLELTILYLEQIRCPEHPFFENNCNQSSLVWSLSD